MIGKGTVQAPARGARKRYVGMLRKKYSARNPKITSGDHAAMNGGN